MLDLVGKGLVILSKYYGGDTYDFHGTCDNCTYDNFYLSPTPNPLPDHVVEKLIKLCWTQDVFTDDFFSLGNYDPKEPWQYICDSM